MLLYILNLLWACVDFWWFGFQLIRPMWAERERQEKLEKLARWEQLGKEIRRMEDEIAMPPAAVPLQAVRQSR